MLHAQLLWPVSALLVLYSVVVAHVRHCASPMSANWPAAHAAPHTALLTVVQLEFVALPAQEEQAEQGAKPEAL